MKKQLFLICLITVLGIIQLSAQEKANNPPIFTFKWDKGFKLTSADENFKLKFGGRIMIDHAFFFQNNDLDNGFGELDTKSGTEFRRARLFTSGTIYGNVFFKFQVDFAGNKTTIKDAYLGVKEIPFLGNIRIGHFKEPFRLEALTSSKYIIFMERALSIDFMQIRNNGLLLLNNDFFDKKLSAQAGIFRNENNSSSDKAANDGFAVTGRITGLPFVRQENKQLWHVGVGASYRKPDTKEFGISSRPEAHLSGIKYISTGTIDNVNNVFLLNFETAFVTGPLLFQGEYLFANVDLNKVAIIDNYKFSGFYGQASYFLTGESRKYKSSYLGFDRVIPNKNFGSGGLGAWELALRFSYSDLNSENLYGGKQADLTAGVNWHLNPSSRIMFNYIYAHVKDKGTIKVKGNARIFQMRFQVDF